MHKYLAFTAFGWLALSGVLHFVIDVVSQYVRGVRAPGNEATLYYGLHSSYALSLVLYGITGVFLATRALELLGQTPLILLTLVAAVAWLAIGFAFIEYREPKIMMGIFIALFLAFAVTR